MKITPRAGDYVRLEFMTEAQYHAAAKAFISAGFGSGEYPSDHEFKIRAVMGIHKSKQDIFHGIAKSGNDDYVLNGRELSLSDLLGEEVVWSSDGWPPVGTECEFSYNKVNWFATKILFMGSKMAVFTTGHADEIERSASLREIIFRPLKSERELAIGEMLNINTWSVTLEQQNAMKRLCGQLYDAGYRKTKDAEK